MRRFLVAWFCVAATAVIGVTVDPDNLAAIAFIVIFIAFFAVAARAERDGDSLLRGFFKITRSILLFLLLPKDILERRRSILGLMVIASLTAMLVPPWTTEMIYGAYRLQQFRGFTFILMPPSPTRLVHINYGWLGLEFAAITLTGGFLMLFLGHSGSRQEQPERPPEHASKELLAAVIAGFTKVARKRGESLTEAELHRIKLFFLHQQRTFGAEFTRQHLTYELDKYEREGLRNDYREKASTEASSGSRNL